MERAAFTDALLGVMEAKEHWAWEYYTQGRVERGLLHIHLEQEYATYVRDFPVLVARAYVSCPIPAVRRDLIENVFEEETGRLGAGRPHPELFLEYPRGLGMDLKRFERVELLPGARAYRDYLDRCTLDGGWDVAAAVTTLFLEGTKFDRGELEGTAPRRPTPELTEHPLVKHYGLPLEALALTRAHRSVEGGHRAAAWRSILDHVHEPTRQEAVLTAMRGVLASWLGYRDDVAAACGIVRRDDHG
ncbi:MAG TPA: iron-containing redox enzyme family protein [Polyangiaceae bacterium]|nr:iron-containing redox enzyme family protein [Polyangiaceae bacterium]